MEKTLPDSRFQQQVQRQWETVCLLGGCAALLAFGATLFDIVFGSISVGDLAELPQTAIGRFGELRQSRFLGLYHLDLLNVLISIVMIPVFFALFAIHRRTQPAPALLALILALVGATVFISTNSALPMLELSRKYFAATDEARKNLIAAAGEALLVRTEHGSLGVLIGFAFSSLASLGMSLVMVQGRVFSRTVSWFGVAGHTLLLVYTLLVTFVAEVRSMAVLVATPGGLLAFAWLLMVGITLIRKRG